MPLLELFRFLVPMFASAPDADVLAAIELAATYRPACLSQAEQDRAQVLYAAYLMYLRALQAGTVRDPSVQSEKEGDLSRTYRAGVNVTTDGDPYGFYGQWKALAALCVGGGITVGTKHGPCCC